MPKHKQLDPAEEQEWLDEQEQNVLRYLNSENIAADGDLQIEWCIAPIVALWRADCGDETQMWIICGDLPTDFVRDSAIVDGRQAMKALCRRWLEVAGYLLQGAQHPKIQMGSGLGAAEMKELGNLLQRRAMMLQEWTVNDAKWAEGTA